MSNPEFLQIVSQGKDLSEDQAFDALTAFLNDEISKEVFRNYLVALFKKGEVTAELVGTARALLQAGATLDSKWPDLVDTAGTGGDQKGTFNFSTATAFVLAGAGCHVAKHGNRAVTSKSGSADILQALGLKLDLNLEQVKTCLDEIGMAFLFAPQFYPIFAKVGPIRKSLEHRSIFNFMGPLLNPARAPYQLLGVYDRKFVRPMAEAALDLGSKSTVVVNSLDGMDEFSLTSKAHVCHVKDGSIKEFEFDPRESGYSFCDITDLKGGTPEENAERMKLTLKGHSMPLDHVVHVNAAWALVACEKAETFMDGLLMAQQSVSSGAAYHKLEELVEFTNRN